jgi:hypothetical protein
MQTGDPFVAFHLAGAAMDLHALFKACFTGETLLEAEGGLKRADGIRVGDRLWSRDEHTPGGPVALKAVEEVFVRVAPVWNLHVAGRIIRTTAEHPFYAEGKGWLPCWALRSGDRLHTKDGRLVAVEGVADSGAVETVYNWRVADFHTYFVGDQEWGFSVWAHNADYTNELKKRDDAARKILDYRLGGKPGDGKSAHHIIPWEWRDDPVVKAAAKGGFNMNGTENGILLSSRNPRRIHPQGFKHPDYNREVGEMLDKIGTRTLTPAQAAKTLKNLAGALGKGLNNLTTRIDGAFELLPPRSSFR